MAAFNILKERGRCFSCGREIELHLQFQYGDTWQYEYKLGDLLRWGGNDNGHSGAARVVLEAPAEACPYCGFEDDYEIFVEHDRLVSFRRVTGEYDFAKEHEYFIVLDP